MAKIVTRGVKGVGRILLSKEEVIQLPLGNGTYLFCQFKAKGRYLDILQISTMTKEFELFPQVRKRSK